MKKVHCEFCDKPTKTKYWVPVMVQNRKKPLMVFTTCEICGLYVQRVWRRTMSAFIKRMEEK